MERNVRLVLAYDGTDFHGWQSQPGQRTVQAELARVVQRVVRRPVDVVGASRTDAGVHARGQVAHVLTDCRLPVDNLQRAVVDRLPPDVTLVHAAEVSPDFHATRAARGKLYRYTIYHTPHRPVEELATRYAWHVWHPLDLDAMRAAAAALVGRHDFVAYANQGSARECTVRTVTRIAVQRRYQRVCIDVEGDGFLYNQVRVMTGTLVEIGRGHWPPQRAGEALAARERRLAGPTAPAHGLCLQWVRYEPGLSAGSPENAEFHRRDARATGATGATGVGDGT
jgi:tRNA pseudouridine38-40 synthase